MASRRVLLWFFVSILYAYNEYFYDAAEKCARKKYPLCRD